LKNHLSARSCFARLVRSGRQAGILKLKISVISILILASFSCAKREENQKTKESQSDTKGLSSDKGKQNLQVDSTILITDSLGNILGGDTSDWDFVNDNYKDILRKGFASMYNNPDKIYGGEASSFFSEVIDKTVMLTWFTGKEIICKGFDIERTKGTEQNSDWEKVDFVKCIDKPISMTYKYFDENLPDGVYRYRLKQISANGNFEYHVLPNEVVMTNYDKVFEFYPAYPNPVADKFTVSVFLSQKDTVSLYFLNGKDSIYILNHEPQQRGFYELTVDTKTLGFENEIARLYINCESCSKKKNFGDIQF